MTKTGRTHNDPNYQPLNIVAGPAKAMLLNSHFIIAYLLIGFAASESIRQALDWEPSKGFLLLALFVGLFNEVYFFLCIFVSLFFAMTGGRSEIGFWQTGKQVVPQLLFVGIFAMGTGIIFTLLINVVFSLAINGFVQPEGLLNNIKSKDGFYLSLLICIYMTPMLIIARFHPQNEMYYAKAWFIDGIKFFFRNFGFTNPLIGYFIPLCVLSVLKNIVFEHPSDFHPGLLFSVSLIHSLAVLYMFALAMYVVISRNWYPFAQGPYGFKLIASIKSVEEKKIADSLLEPTNIGYIMYPGFEDAMQLLENEELQSTGIFVKKDDYSDEMAASLTSSLES